jgi:membrane protein YdbS with pleckstrin-like domain
MLATPHERIVVDARRHGVVLVWPLARAAALAGVGGLAFLGGWPISVAGGVLLAAAALLAVASVYRWDRTRVVLTTEKLFVVQGLVRRRASAVHLGRVGRVEIEQTMLGRLLGYGTLVAGELEIPYVPEARRVAGLVGRSAS